MDVICYVDGFNLYHGLRSKNWRKYYWLDLWSLAERFLLQDQSLKELVYCTSRVLRDQDGLARQLKYIDALSAYRDNTILKFGNYLINRVRCPKCGFAKYKHEEKMTDVNIACQLLMDAVDDKFDTALIVSGDSDLVPPIQLIRNRFPEKKLITLFPPNRESNALKVVSHGYKHIAEIDLRNAQLPDQVELLSWKLIHRPKSWR